MLREWQSHALKLWQENSCRGIVGAVTGGGKTIFALACLQSAKPRSALIVVPTTALLDQWWEEVSNFFNVPLDSINIVTPRNRVKAGSYNIGVINSVSKLSNSQIPNGMMLIVDECHKAASQEFRRILTFNKTQALGLSATPERPYDDGLSSILEPGLGPVLFKYTYEDALRDKVIVPFELRNIVFDLEEDVDTAYSKATKSIARSISKYGMEAPETISALLKRSRILNGSPSRVKVAIKIALGHIGQKTIIFHEDVASCEAMYSVLSSLNAPSCLYHSELTPRVRAETLKRFRSGDASILITCRALDEGFNVPETQIGIIAASTATKRQRIQRLGRTLRPANGKESSIIYTIVASDPEIRRLKEEEEDLRGVANISWMHA